MASLSSPIGGGDGENNTPISSISGEQETGTPAEEETQITTAAAMVSAPPAPERDFPPGYRFVPTDEELILKYLKPKINDEPIPLKEMTLVNLYEYDPQYLSETYPRIGDTEWYFFTPRERKYPNGRRPNRAAGNYGYWKATGADKMVTDAENRCVGFRKALVFYIGKPPHGEKTNWIMHEYRMDQPERVKTNPKDMRLDDFVLCRIYTKPFRHNQNQNREVSDANAVAAGNDHPHAHVAEEQQENHNAALNNALENVENPAPALMENFEDIEICESLVAQLDPCQSFADAPDYYDFSMSPLIDNTLGLINWDFPQDYSANLSVQNSYLTAASASSSASAADSFLPGPSTSAFQDSDSVVKSENTPAGKRRRL